MHIKLNKNTMKIEPMLKKSGNCKISWDKSLNLTKICIYLNCVELWVSKMQSLLVQE